MSEFSTNLRRIRTERKLTQEELADGLNVRYGGTYSKGMISKWENGIVDPNMGTLKNIARFFDTTTDELLGIRVVDHNIRKVDKFIPIIGVISAGIPIMAEQNIVGYTPAPAHVRYRECDLFYLRVRGDSMNKEFPDGSDVLVDKDADVESGNIAVVLVNGYDATVKMVKFEDNKIVLIPLSTNTDHYAQAYDMEKDEVKIIGKVIGAFKRY